MSTATLPYLSVPPERIGVHAPAGSLPTETRLGTVRLQVADLGRSLGFYQLVLGFRLLQQQAAAEGHGAVAHLGAVGSNEVLLELHEKPGVRPVPRRGLLGIYHFAVLLPSRPDLGRFVRHIREAGVPLGSSDHNYSEATYLVDPDGITVEVYRDRPRSEWQVTAQGEIQSALDPMDTHGLLAAAGAEPWAGLPAGTTLGHMHLYVGDLGQAAAFYHVALGLDKVTWSLTGALFVSAGGYHHHLGLNVWAASSPAATDDDARLLRWELVLPTQASAEAAAQRLRQAGYAVEATAEGHLTRDPWGSALLLRVG